MCGVRQRAVYGVRQRAVYKTIDRKRNLDVMQMLCFNKELHHLVAAISVHCHGHDLWKDSHVLRKV